MKPPGPFLLRKPLSQLGKPPLSLSISWCLVAKKLFAEVLEPLHLLGVPTLIPQALLPTHLQEPEAKRQELRLLSPKVGIGRVSGVLMRRGTLHIATTHWLVELLLI